MSDTDSFIDEVTEEVRRDRLFGMIRRYGWIAIALVVLLVGGTAWNEWRKAQAETEAQAFGDALLAALEQPDEAERANALRAITASGPGSRAVLDLLTANAEAASDPARAAERLLALAQAEGVPSAYREIATLRAVALPEGGLSADERRSALEGLALGQGSVRALAEEQLAYLDIEAGDTEAALGRLNGILADPLALNGVRNRATQIIIALGGTPDAAAEPAQTPAAD